MASIVAEEYLTWHSLHNSLQLLSNIHLSRLNSSPGLVTVKSFFAHALCTNLILEQHDTLREVEYLFTDDIWLHIAQISPVWATPSEPCLFIT